MSDFHKPRVFTLSRSKDQSGAALVVVLILLTIITLLGIANMQSASMEMKMVTATVDRNRALALAEAGLTQVESLLEENFYDIDHLYQSACQNREECFSSTCADGWCFQGNYTVDHTRLECEAYYASADPSGAGREKYWEDESVFDNAEPIRISFGEGTQYDVKYIAEFLCFIQDTPETAFDVDYPDNGSPLFRITVYVEGERGLSPVMLQSNYSYQI